MASYQYDACGSFRGWLRRLCYHRAIDLLASAGTIASRSWMAKS